MKEYKTAFEWAKNLHFEEKAAKHHFPLLAGLLTSISRQESLGYAHAHNRHSGASGLFQIIPSVAHHYHIDPYNAKQAAKVAAIELTHHYKHYHGDLEKVLAAYNWGSGHVRRAVKKYGDDWLDHAPRETRKYVRNILQNMEMDGYIVSHPRPSQNADCNAPLEQSEVVVKGVQEHLKILGYNCPSHGAFDEDTKAALVQFKQDMRKKGVTFHGKPIPADDTLDLASINIMLRPDRPVTASRRIPLPSQKDATDALAIDNTACATECVEITPPYPFTATMPAGKKGIPTSSR